MISNDSIHLPKAGISILVNTRGKQSTIVFAFCNPKDSFNKKAANKILNGRLKTNRNPIKIEYIGSTPRKDVLFPIADFIREHLGFTFDSDTKQYRHPDTFGMPGFGGIEEMDIFEPDTPVSRSVTETVAAIVGFINSNFNVQSQTEQAPSIAATPRIEGAVNPNGAPIGTPAMTY